MLKSSAPRCGYGGSSCSAFAPPPAVAREAASCLVAGRWPEHLPQLVGGEQLTDQSSGDGFY